MIVVVVEERIGFWSYRDFSRFFCRGFFFGGFSFWVRLEVFRFISVWIFFFMV